MPGFRTVLVYGTLLLQEKVMTKILIITKDMQFSRILSTTLIYNGFIVESATTEAVARKYLEEIRFSLILMDFKTTDEITFYQNLNDLAYKPAVIMMGENFEECSLLEKMYKGMDDYILKPFGISELKMIINRQLERKELMLRPIVYGDLRIDVAKSLVTVKDKIISLGKKELEALIILTRKAGKIVARDTLLTEQRMSALKKKLSGASRVLQIKSISGGGYKLTLTDPCL
jgi:DNA-binding response OmpR family regulator